jgi:hypothetical protein
MQINVKNIEYIRESINILNKYSEHIERISSEKINKIIRFLEEIIQELNISNNFLSVAKVQETEKLAILTQKEVQLSSALQKEAAALSSGNPVAIAAASALVAQNSHEVYIANQNYQRAKRNRINMGKRVELVHKAKIQNEKLLEMTQNVLKANLSKINSFKIQVSTRLQNAYRELSEYFNYSDLKSVELDDLISIIKLNERNRIDKQSKYSSDINDYISTTEELNVYEKEALEEGKVNDRIILKDSQIDFGLEDSRGRTNIERMNKGLAPLDENGRPYNLHHIGQKVDSPLAELKDDVHKDNDAILHDKTIPTEVHGGDINWDSQRAKHWKKRAKKIEEGLEKIDV